MTRKIFNILLSFFLLFEQSGLAQIAASADLSGFLSVSSAGSFISEPFRPAHLRYLSYDNLTNNFDLMVDAGSLKDRQEHSLREETRELLSYFLVGLTLPSDNFWVNLRPDSPGNVIDPALEKTDVGRIMLEADVQLKKDTALATSLNTAEGKEYWRRLYAKAEELYGTTLAQIPTVVRPWIVPDEIIIRESADDAYIYKATLKVMLEEDYLKMAHGPQSTDHGSSDRERILNEYAARLMRELVIPKLTKDINSSQRYAVLRQVYYSLILAHWFKEKFRGKEGTYSRMIDSGNLEGLISKNPWSKEEYFKEYQRSFNEGEYNIKEQRWGFPGQVLRSYASGGIKVEIGPAIQKGISINPPGKQELPLGLKENLRPFSVKGGATGNLSAVDITAVPSSAENSVSKDLGGPGVSNETANARIREWISQGKAVKLRFDRDKAVLYKPRFVEGYAPGGDDFSDNEVLSENILTDDEIGRLKDYIELALGESGLKADDITIGIIRGETMVNAEDAGAFTIVHAGTSTRTIWFGELLLRDILRDETDLDAIEIFEHDVDHIVDDKFARDNHDSYEYEHLRKRVKTRCARINADKGIKRFIREAKRVGHFLQNVPFRFIFTPVYMLLHSNKLSEDIRAVVGEDNVRCFSRQEVRELTSKILYFRLHHSDSSGLQALRDLIAYLKMKEFRYIPMFILHIVLNERIIQEIGWFIKLGNSSSLNVFEELIPCFKTMIFANIEWDFGKVDLFFEAALRGSQRAQAEAAGFLPFLSRHRNTAYKMYWMKNIIDQDMTFLISAWNNFPLFFSSADIKTKKILLETLVLALDSLDPECKEKLARPVLDELALYFRDYILENGMDDSLSFTMAWALTLSGESSSEISNNCISAIQDLSPVFCKYITGSEGYIDFQMAFIRSIANTSKGGKSVEPLLPYLRGLITEKATDKFLKETAINALITAVSEGSSAAKDVIDYLRAYLEENKDTELGQRLRVAMRYSRVGEYELLEEIKDDIALSVEKIDMTMPISRITRDLLNNLDNAFYGLDLSGLALGTKEYIKIVLLEELLYHDKLSDIFMMGLRKDVIPSLRLLEEMSRKFPCLGVETKMALNTEDNDDTGTLRVSLGNYLSLVGQGHQMGESFLGGDNIMEMRILPTTYPIFLMMMEKLHKLGIVGTMLYSVSVSGDYMQEARLLLISLFFANFPAGSMLPINPQDTSGGWTFPGLGGRFIGATIDPWTGRLLDRNDPGTKGTQTNFFHSAIRVPYDDSFSYLVLFRGDLFRTFVLGSAAAAYLKSYGSENELLASRYKKFKAEIMEFLFKNDVINEKADIDKLYPNYVPLGHEYTRDENSVLYLMKIMEKYFRVEQEDTDDAKNRKKTLHAKFSKIVDDNVKQLYEIMFDPVERGIIVNALEGDFSIIRKNNSSFRPDIFSNGDNGHKNLGGAGAVKEGADERIRQWIKEGKAVKLRFDGDKVVVYKPRFDEDYASGSDDLSEGEVLAEVILTDDEIERLKDYIELALGESGLKTEDITIGIIRGMALVNPAEDDSYSIVHAGTRTRTIWLGEFLLKDLLAEDTDLDAMEIFEHDIKHITDNEAAVGEHGTDKYDDLLKRVSARCLGLESKDAQGKKKKKPRRGKKDYAGLRGGKTENAGRSGKGFRGGGLNSAEEAYSVFLSRMFPEGTSPRLLNALVRIKDESLRMRQTLFTQEEMNAILDCKEFDIKSFLERLESERRAYIFRRDGKGKRIFSDKNIDDLLYGKLIPVLWMDNLMGNGLSKSFAMTMALGWADPEAEWAVRKVIRDELVADGELNKSFATRLVMKWSRAQSEWEERKVIRDELRSEGNLSKSEATRMVLQWNDPAGEWEVRKIIRDALMTEGKLKKTQATMIVLGWADPESEWEKRSVFRDSLIKEENMTRTYATRIALQWKDPSAEWASRKIIRDALMTESGLKKTPATDLVLNWYNPEAKFKAVTDTMQLLQRSGVVDDKKSLWRLLLVNSYKKLSVILKEKYAKTPEEIIVLLAPMKEYEDSYGKNAKSAMLLSPVIVNLGGFEFLDGLSFGPGERYEVKDGSLFVRGNILEDVDVLVFDGELLDTNGTRVDEAGMVLKDKDGRFHILIRIEEDDDMKVVLTHELIAYLSVSGGVDAEQENDLIHAFARANEKLGIGITKIEDAVDDGTHGHAVIPDEELREALSGLKDAEAVVVATMEGERTENDDGDSHASDRSRESSLMNEAARLTRLYDSNPDSEVFVNALAGKGIDHGDVRKDIYQLLSKSIRTKLNSITLSYIQKAGSQFLAFTDAGRTFVIKFLRIGAQRASAEQYLLKWKDNIARGLASEFMNLNPDFVSTMVLDNVSIATDMFGPLTVPLAMLEEYVVPVDEKLEDLFQTAVIQAAQFYPGKKWEDLSSGQIDSLPACSRIRSMIEKLRQRHISIWEHGVFDVDPKVENYGTTVDEATVKGFDIHQLFEDIKDSGYVSADDIVEIYNKEVESFLIELDKGFLRYFKPFTSEEFKSHFRTKLDDRSEVSHLLNEELRDIVREYFYSLLINIAKDEKRPLGPVGSALEDNSGYDISGVPRGDVSENPVQHSQEAVAAANKERKSGGIDFGALPALTQARSEISPSLNLPKEAVSFSNLEAERLEIQNLLRSGVLPSDLRVEEYLQGCRASKNRYCFDRGIVCVSDILKLEEQRAVPSSQRIKQLLSMLESGV